MSRTKNQGVAAAEDLAESAGDRVAPLIHSAADRVGPIAQAAADRVAPLAQSAADVVGPLAHDAADRIAPFAHAAADRVQPYAHQAAEAIAPYAHQAADAVAPYAQTAADKVAPYAKSVQKHGAHAAQEAADKLAPKLDDARDRVQSDWLPKLADRLSEAAQGAANSPAAIEAQKRSRAAAAALRGELVLPEDGPATKKGSWVKRIGLIAVLGGLVFFVAKRFLGDKDSDWQTARPTPYTSTTITEPSAPSTPDLSPTAPGAEDLPNPASVVADHDSVFEVAPDAADVAVQPAHAADDDTAIEPAEADRSGYGEHAFIGPEPPEAFTIKGNERSKKYHLPESAGYGRTHTEVWFDSEEAAESAGFTKAQR